MSHSDGILSMQDDPVSSTGVSIGTGITSSFVAPEQPLPSDDGAGTITSSQARDAFERGTVLKKAGLFKRAAVYFEHAAQDPVYTVKGLAQMGLCFKLSGNMAEAVIPFQRAVQAASGAQKKQVPILYLLGKTLESLGRAEEALETYRWIRGVNPGYRDVADRIERLSSRRANAKPRTLPNASSGAWTGDLVKAW